MIDAALVARMARLARLELEPDEAGRLVREIQALLTHVANVERVATEGVTPTAHPLDLGLPRAPDAPREGLAADAALAAAPAREEDFFRVPPVLEES